MNDYSLSRRLVAEFIGTALLLATVVGSGIMGERLAGGNEALALLGNTIPTGAILIVIILIFGPVSGAHFNPAVTAAFLVRGEIGARDSLFYIVFQLLGGIAGVLLAHYMFEAELFQIGTKVRAGPAQFTSEIVAAFGLVAAILGTLSFRPEAVAYAVGLFISAGYWFTASTSFANPAVAVARALTDTFSGIRPIDAPPFIVAQFIGALLAVWLFKWMFAGRQ